MLVLGFARLREECSAQFSFAHRLCCVASKMEGGAEEKTKDTASKGRKDVMINVPPQEKPFSLWPGKYHSPVTAALWHARSSFVERARNISMDGPAQSTLQSKTPEENRTHVLYNFSTDNILREEYRNPWNSVRIGKLLEDLDALAGTIAVKVLEFRPIFFIIIGTVFFVFFSFCGNLVS